jgi:putative pyruvate formate lyase activating enzyme
MKGRPAADLFMKKVESGYLALHAAGDLARRAAEAERLLVDCHLCPRECGVNRLAGEKGVCRTGRNAMVASYAAHFGEEQPLVGTNGSGTIFFSNCNLLCLFCQNYEISHLGEGEEVTAEQLAAMMLSLQRQGCHNINFVTPSHVVPQILSALVGAVDAGLTIPLVYNSSGYDSLETLRLLDGIIDIYMPDMKFWDSRSAKRYAGAGDYPQAVRAAVKEMHRQVGDLVINHEGLAVRGLLVRHLVMPGGLSETGAILQFIAQEISANTYVNVMDQYRPCGRAYKKPPINRCLSAAEYQEALLSAEEAGLRRLDKRDWAGILRKLKLY